MNFLLYITIICIWGTTWLALTYQAGSVSLDVSIFYRFTLASLLIFGWCFFRKKNLKFSRRDHLFFMGQGFFLFSMNFIAAYAAAQYLPSGLNAIGFSVILIFNIMNSFIFYRMPLSFPLLLGTLSGIVGMATIFWVPLSTLDLSSDSLFGIFLSLLGALLASFGNMIALGNQKKSIPVTESNAYAMGYGALFMLGIILFKGVPLQFELSSTYILSLLHLTILGSVVGFGCYLTLLGRIGANKASYAVLPTSMVALGLSSLFENFSWDFYTFTGVGLVLLGNVIILIRKSVPINKEINESIGPVPVLKQAT